VDREKEAGSKQYGEFQKRPVVMRMDVGVSDGGLRY
jgi:hypothetical protein